MAKNIDRLSGQGKLVMIVGMQFGSEGKGAIASYLAPLMSLGVRTGAANAGHTIYFRGEKFTMRQIPTTWVNPDAKLVIGVGAMISTPLLLEEIARIEQYLPIRGRLFIDSKAHVVQEEHIRRESLSDLAARIGSTSATSREGIGAAQAAKVLREKSCVLARDVPELQQRCVDTVDLVNGALDDGQFVTIEGTQGFGLSLEHGDFPFVTSRDTSSAALAASVGVNPPAFNTEVIGVVRTFPIRVAGPSGSFDADSTELLWEEVTRRAGADQPIVERTSVTNKVRRVATFSEEGFLRACRVNRPTEIAVTFADYLNWRVHEKEEMSLRSYVFIKRLEALAYKATDEHVPVTLVQTGPRTTVDLDYYRHNILRRIAI